MALQGMGRARTGSESIMGTKVEAGRLLGEVTGHSRAVGKEVGKRWLLGTFSSQSQQDLLKAWIWAVGGSGESRFPRSFT